MSSIDDKTDLKLNKDQKDLINRNLDENGRLSCIDAFIVAKKGGIALEKMSAATKSMGIRISDCELGVFGRLDFSPKDETIYEEMLERYNKEKELDCKIYWDEAKNSNLHKVGSTVKNSDFEVINCQLGCFRLRRGKKRT